MPQATKTPNIESAAVTARVISRMLRKNGFKMADTCDRHRWTEGAHVHRVGYGSLVSVDYHIPGYNEKDRPRRREERDKVRAFLVGRGYVFLVGPVAGGYIQCEGP